MALMHWGRATAVGTLELLWHFAAEFAPQGDIGKYDDRRIEAALDYLPHGQRKTGLLIAALTESKWLDKDALTRLKVHHWADHCQSNTVQRLAKKGLTVFPNQSYHNDTDISAQEKSSALPCLALPMPCHALPEDPLKPPGAKSSPESLFDEQTSADSQSLVRPVVHSKNGKGRRTAASLEISAEQRGWFQQFLALHPKNTIQTASATRLWQEKVKTAECFEFLMGCLRREAAGNTTYLHGPGKWLADHLELFANGVAPAAAPHKETTAEMDERIWRELHPEDYGDKPTH
jgi:hypothetical protein